MIHTSRIVTNATTIRQAYAPVLLERKAAKIRKSMDEEKARGIMIRTPMDASDRQCVRLNFIVMYTYTVFRTVGKPYSLKPLLAPSSYSFTNP